MPPAPPTTPTHILIHKHINVYTLTHPGTNAHTGTHVHIHTQVLELQNTVEQQREQLAIKERQLSAAAASVSAVANMGIPGSPLTPGA